MRRPLQKMKNHWRHRWLFRKKADVDHPGSTDEDRGHRDEMDVDEEASLFLHGVPEE